MLPAPITAGPRTVLRSTRAPGSITTRPSTLESISSPSTLGSRSSSTRRFASSMSASWPVSFHQPLTRCCSTVWPVSIRCWIVSVISSSPRADGSIARAASKTSGGEHVDADQGQVRGRVLRLLDEAHDPLAVELGDAVVLGVEHLGEQDQRVGLVAAEGLDQPGDPVAEQVVAEVHDERGVADELLGGEHRVGEPERLRLGDVGDRGAERGAVADGLADLIAGLRRDHDPDLGHPGRRPAPRSRRRARACSRRARAASRTCG